MSRLPYKAGGILMPVNPALHLFTIMNDPCPRKECLVVMVTSIYPNRKYDDACVLNVGDHPFISHPSYMLYRMAETLQAARISTRIGQKYYIPRDDFSPPVFRRIVDGLYESEETKGRILSYAQANAI